MPSIEELADSLLVDKPDPALAGKGTPDAADPIEDDAAALAAADDTADADEAAGTDDNPEDGTVEAEAEAGEGEAEGEQPDDADGTDPFLTVEIDGKQARITRTEAKAGYLRQQDYTRKTQEVAAERTKAAEITTALSTHRDQYAAMLTTLQERIGPADKEPTQGEWDTLQANDPERFAAEWAGYQRRQEQRTIVSKEQERVEGERRNEQVKNLNEFVKAERVKLHEKLPAWKDPEKAKAGMKAIREYAAATYGYTEAELDAAVDHRTIVMVDKARLYDELMAKQAKVKQQLADAPDMPEPAPRKPAVRSRRAAQREDAQKKFDRSGKPDDAVALMFR